MKKEKKLRFWNGRGHGICQNGKIYVAAYSKAQACELVGQACELYRPISYSEITHYYAECWGNPMKGIMPTEPCVYVNKDRCRSDTPVKII
jgi:hypothetical protein